MRYQIRTRDTSLLKVMTTRDFVRGAQDGASGASWPTDLKTTWDYERGRLFGVLHPDVPVKVGRAVNRTALTLATIALVEKAII